MPFSTQEIVDQKARALRMLGCPDNGPAGSLNINYLLRNCRIGRVTQITQENSYDAERIQILA